MRNEDAVRLDIALQLSGVEDVRQWFFDIVKQAFGEGRLQATEGVPTK